MFKGSMVALITPFRDGKVDAAAFRDFVAWQIEQGTHGLVPCGTTGESPTLSHQEHMEVTEMCVEVANGKVPVVAGTGSNSTSEAIELTQHAQKAGADGALVVTPYYNKPTQAGMYAHFKAIHDATDIPIIIYNIPPRSVIDMSVETMARLAELPRIVGVKDASNDLARPLKLRVALKNDKEFCQLSGEDATAVPLLSQGGVGCISVTANVAPKLCALMHEAWQRKDLDEVDRINKSLMPLHDALFCETSPSPVKYAASLLGKCSAEVRLPLAEASPNAQDRVREAMNGIGLLN